LDNFNEDKSSGYKMIFFNYNPRDIYGEYQVSMAQGLNDKDVQQLIDIINEHFPHYKER
jgi:hypothetical protein